MRLIVLGLAVLFSVGAALIIGAHAADSAPPPATESVRATTNKTDTAPRALAVSDVVTLPATPATPPVAQPAEDPFRWDATKKDVDVKTNEVGAQYFFYVTNVSATDVYITNLEAGCSCTVAQLPYLPYKIAPGAFGRIDATVDVRNSFGSVIKQLTAHTSAGPRVLYMQANVPMRAENPLGERLLNQQIARADRQSLFKGDCAKCHLAPAQGKQGEPLFTAACGICHLSEQRAAMVPDLATLKVRTSADYWRLWMIHGKVGSLMPAWAQDQGGPLSPEQIESLTQYLTKRYPSATAPK